MRSVASPKPIANGSGDHHATTAANGSQALTNGASEEKVTPDGEDTETTPPTENVFQLTIKLPRVPRQTEITVSTQEQVQDIRQSIVDTPQTFQYSCFHLEHQGKRINDFVELSEIPGIVEDPVLQLVEDPYTEAQARMHVVRVRELIGAAGNRTDLVVGIDAGLSLCDGVELPEAQSGKEEASPVADYNLSTSGSVATLLSKPRESAPKTVKNLSLSSWNAPPYHLRMRGHLLYLQVTTHEGEQHYITSHVSGFYVNKSTNHKFDPTPRSSPKAASAHSLVNLLSEISPSFDGLFQRLQVYNGQRDPLASYQLSNCLPAAPWVVSASSVQQHQADITRSQETFLLGGADNAETLRDWNEEFQSTRELPKETVHERVFRERLTSKLFAEYNEAAVRGACLVARGEIQPLNPTESRDAQIFVYNNVFYSFGADGVGTFASDGGDEAARVATGKDVKGVKAVNQLDITGLFTPGTVVVDYLGKRVVGQSIVPGIFKQREPGENQIDYGGVEGKDVIATHDGFVKPFQELSAAMRVKKHAVWDKENKKHDLEASVETKGLLGTDGRKYILDLYRVTPLDITWIEKHRGQDQSEESRYPHRMTVLRPELVELYRVSKVRDHINAQIATKRAASGDVTAKASSKDEPNATAGAEEKTSEDIAKDEQSPTNGAGVEKTDEESKQQQQESFDLSGFSFSLNPDVFSGQRPQEPEEKAEWEQDEADVRAVCAYLSTEVIPRLVKDLQEGDVGFPMDGQSLVREMHRRGINVRYLGEIARQCAENPSNSRLQALKQLCQQEMVSRAFKHICNKEMRALPPVFAQSCIAHMLNCLLGTELNSTPKAEVEDDIKALYSDTSFEFEKIVPEGLSKEIKRQIALRYRYEVQDDLVQKSKQPQMLREISRKMGIQLEAKDYQYAKLESASAPALQEKKSSDSFGPQTNGTESNKKGKNKKKHAESSTNGGPASAPVAATATFHPENIFNIVPIVKEASPRSVLAEEALDAGRMSIQQGQRELGQELLLESLSLHEQIYGILHPEVARVYYALSTLYYGLDEKSAAVELAKKAVIVSERTLGVDDAETVLAYLNLSLFEHANGNTRQALMYVRHALDLWKIVYGIRHPDSITTINNAAVMLQTLKQFHESRLWFEASLEICEEVAGKLSVNTATLLFQLAQAFALESDSKAAMEKMRESARIFTAELGAEDANTKEAELWLSRFTASAVNQAKQAKQANLLLQNRNSILRNGARTSRITTGTRQLPPIGQTTAPVSQPIPAPPGTENLDEIVRYINGKDPKPSTPKKKSTNPKKRSQKA